MKIGYRKPSVKKSLSARTTGRAKRMLKSSINPTYGKNGMGLINNPKKAVYNKIYNQTTSGYQEFLGHNKEQNFSETTGRTFCSWMYIRSGCRWNTILNIVEYH